MRRTNKTAWKDWVGSLASSKVSAGPSRMIPRLEDVDAERELDRGPSGNVTARVVRAKGGGKGCS